MKFKGSLIVVKDCRKALKFYQDMFGFELIRDHDGKKELLNYGYKVGKISLKGKTVDFEKDKGTIYERQVL